MQPVIVMPYRSLGIGVCGVDAVVSWSLLMSLLRNNPVAQREVSEAIQVNHHHVAGKHGRFELI